MKIYIVGCFVFLAHLGVAQNSNIYTPDGQQYDGDKHTLEHISIEMEPEGRVYHYSPFIAAGDDITTIGFMLFTDSALWVMTHKPHLIDSAISLFDKRQFFESPEFSIALNAFINKGVLTKEFIRQTLGEPTHKRNFITKTGNFDRWAYPQYNLDLILEQGVVTHYIDRSR